MSFFLNKQIFFFWKQNVLGEVGWFGGREVRTKVWYF